MNLAGKKILLGVSGGIAAYKSCELLRLLQKKGAEVRVCMTEAATQFVAPLTFASLSKCPVYLKNGAVEARPFQHIDFPRWADLYLVVPATANVIGKFVYGIADDPVSLCFMSCTGPRFIAPAMNVAMFNSPAVKRNLETLRSFENTFVMDSLWRSRQRPPPRPRRNRRLFGSNQRRPEQREGLFATRHPE